jgi:hypothetical protein
MALREKTHDMRRARRTVLEAIAPKAAPILLGEDRQALRAAFTETAAQMQAADVKTRMQKLGEAFGLP